MTADRWNESLSLKESREDLTGQVRALDGRNDRFGLFYHRVVRHLFVSTTIMGRSACSLANCGM